MQEGLPLPEKIKNAPELENGLELFIQAFFELSTSRMVGVDYGPIPWVVINEYCNSLEIVEDQRDDVFYHVRALDSTYLEFINRPKSGSK
jgi:hypothetical protein